MAFQELSFKSSDNETKVLESKCFTVSTNDISSGAAGGVETPQLLILNPSNSNLKMKIWKMIFQTNISTNNNIFRLYANPAVLTNGVALTPYCMNIDGLNALSKMGIYKLPTVTGNGVFMTNIIAGATTSVPLMFDNLLILNPGNKLLVGVRPNTTAVTYSINVFWVEE